MVHSHFDGKSTKPKSGNIDNKILNIEDAKEITDLAILQTESSLMNRSMVLDEIKNQSLSKVKKLSQSFMADKGGRPFSDHVLSVASLPGQVQDRNCESERISITRSTILLDNGNFETTVTVNGESNAICHDIGIADVACPNMFRQTDEEVKPEEFNVCNSALSDKNDDAIMTENEFIVISSEHRKVDVECKHELKPECDAYFAVDIDGNVIKEARKDSEGAEAIEGETGANESERSAIEPSLAQQTLNNESIIQPIANEEVVKSLNSSRKHLSDAVSISGLIEDLQAVIENDNNDKGVSNAKAVNEHPVAKVNNVKLKDSSPSHENGHTNSSESSDRVENNHTHFGTNQAMENAPCEKDNIQDKENTTTEQSCAKVLFEEIAPKSIIYEDNVVDANASMPASVSDNPMSMQQDEEAVRTAYVSDNTSYDIEPTVTALQDQCAEVIEPNLPCNDIHTDIFACDTSETCSNATSNVKDASNLPPMYQNVFSSETSLKCLMGDTQKITKMSGSSVKDSLILNDVHSNESLLLSDKVTDSPDPNEDAGMAEPSNIAASTLSGDRFETTLLDAKKPGHFTEEETTKAGIEVSECRKKLWQTVVLKYQHHRCLLLMISSIEYLLCFSHELTKFYIELQVVSKYIKIDISYE